MKKILIVEDDVSISNLLHDLLTQNGYLPMQAYSGTEAVMLLESKTYDLILLDLMLPGKTGEEVLTEIRNRCTTVPVITLTAITDKEHVVSLLKQGANDYITKPFDNAELLARIDVQLRNSNGNCNGNNNGNSNGNSKNIYFREINLDLERFDGFINGNALGLSKREFEILRLFMENPSKVFTKNNLYESVWGDEFFGDDNTINVHISKVRAKIAKHAADEYIQTVWGIGFKMSDNIE